MSFIIGFRIYEHAILLMWTQTLDVTVELKLIKIESSTMENFLFCFCCEKRLFIDSNANFYTASAEATSTYAPLFLTIARRMCVLLS